MTRYKNLAITSTIVVAFVLACGISSSIPTTAEVPTKPLESSTPTLPPPSPAPAIPVTGNLTGSPAELGTTFSYVDGTLLVAVPQGEFIMGSNGTDNSEHSIMLGDFWIYSTKVTNQQYNLCVALGKCSPPNPDDNKGYTDPSRMNDPVVGVSYDQAAAYCDFVNVRLPSEAEWEKAARGPDGNIYPWGNATPSCDLLNFNNCVGMTTNVISYPGGASYYGGLEFAGNTFEWVADWYDPQYYNNSPSENPPGPDAGNTRSVRSSGYDSDLEDVSVANRYFSNPADHRQDLGFRCVVEEPAFFAPFCESVLVYELDSNGFVSAQDFSPTENCPVLDIIQAKYCSKKVPTTNVTFTGPPDSVIDSGNCSPSGDPALFVCQSPDTVSITAKCQLELPGDPACPEGYSKRGNTCIADGAEGQCLDGWNFDSERGCCSSQPGQDSVSSFLLCPTGTFYASEQQACLPYPTQELESSVSITQEVQFQACGSGGGGGGGGCEPQSCGFGSWDSNLCCCTLAGFGCYP